MPTDASFTTVTIPRNIAVTIPANHSVIMQQAEIGISGFLFVGGLLSAGELVVWGDGETFIQGGDVTVIRELMNDGTLVNNGQLLTALRTVNGPSAVFRNADELEIRAGQFADHGFYNHGRFENLAHAVLTATTAGSVVLDSKFRNEQGATVVNKTGAVLDVGGRLTNLGTFVNESAALVTTVAPNGRLENGSVLDNYGTIDNLSTIDNTGGDFRLRCGSALAGNPVGGSAPRNWCDSTAPTLDATAPAVTEATSAAGAIVSYHVRAKDDLDPAPTVSCLPASGATFPLGATTVSCTATDYVGNSGTTAFPVTVSDTTAPGITVLGQQAVVVVQHNDYVDAGATATDTVSGDLSTQIVTTSPVDVDVPGDYTLGYSVSDAAGNVVTATRTVSVITPGGATDTLLGQIESLVTSRSTRTELARFLTQVSQVLHDSRPSNDASACRLLDAFTSAVRRFERQATLSGGLAADLTRQADQIATGLDCSLSRP